MFSLEMGLTKRNCCFRQRHCHKVQWRRACEKHQDRQMYYCSDLFWHCTCKLATSQTYLVIRISWIRKTCHLVRCT